MSTKQRDALEVDALLRAFQEACEAAVNRGDEIGHGKERAILRNELRAALLASRLGAVREDDAPYVTIILDRSGNRVERLWHRGTEHDVAQAMRDWTVMAPTDAPYTSLSLFEHPVARVPEPATEPKTSQGKWVFERFADQMPLLFNADQKAAFLKIAETLRDHGTVTELVAYVQLWAALHSLHKSQPSLLVETTDTTTDTSPGSEAKPYLSARYLATLSDDQVLFSLVMTATDQGTDIGRGDIPAPALSHAINQYEAEVKRRLSRETTDTPEPATQDCRDCDGCGWNEGGPVLKNTCATCRGSGRVPA